MVVHLPQPKQVRELLTDLLGREVTLTPAPPFAPGPDTPASVAVYVDDHLRISALIVCDLTLSAHTGAAIGLVPVGGSEAAIEDGKLTDVLGENLYEVLNVLAALLNAPDCPHVKLTSVTHVGGSPEAEVAAHATAVGRRLDLEVAVPQFGTGRLSIVGLK